MMRRPLLKPFHYVIEFCKHRKYNESLERNNPCNKKTMMPTFHRGIRNLRFFLPRHSLAKPKIWFRVARMIVLASSALNWSKTSNHVNKESTGTILGGNTFGKSPYHYQMPAQAVHNCVPARSTPELEDLRCNQQAESSDG